MSGRAIAEVAERDEHRARPPPDRPPGRPRTPPQQRARRGGRRASPPAAAASSGASRIGDVVEDLGQDPAQPDQHGRPELRVAAQPDDQLDARRRHRLDEQAADRQAVSPPGLEQRQGGAVDRVVALQPERDARRPRSCGRARRRRA